MTVKCCRECIELGKSNLSRTGMICWGQPTVNTSTVVIKNEALDTFYCSSFTRRNSAKKVGGTEETETETEVNTDIPTIQRRFV